jgi:hypothetical protein
MLYQCFEQLLDLDLDQLRSAEEGGEEEEAPRSR